MVLITSRDEDYSTNMVCKWLWSFNIRFLRLGGGNVITALDIVSGDNNEDFSFYINKTQFNYSDIYSYWLRKGSLKLNLQFALTLSEEEEFLASKSLLRYLHEETRSLIEFINYKLKQKPHIGNENVGEGNKLISFSIARECGLKTPQSYISANKMQLKDYFKKHHKLIVKPIEDGYGAIENQLDVSTRYILANEKTFEDVEEQLFPSCLQEYIEKRLS